MNTQSEDDIIATKEALQDAWLNRPGVTGMDVGFKYVGGKRTDEVVIRLSVRKKLQDLPSDQRFPSQFGKHKTDVIEREFKPITTDDTAGYDPILGGIQLESSTWKLGTAGMFARDNVTGDLVILNTFHGTAPVNSPVSQPSAGVTAPNGGTSLVGYVRRIGRQLTPPIDAEVISFGAARAADFGIRELGAILGVRAVGNNVHGLRISKRGRTTGLTQGTVEGVCGTCRENTGMTWNNLMEFKADLTKSQKMADGGDSGSIVLDDSNFAIAMITMISDSQTAQGFPISQIASALDVTPCVLGTILPREISLTSRQIPTRPVSRRLGGDDDDVIPSEWDNSESGTVNINAFPGSRCPNKPYRWTLTNVHHQLKIRAKVLGFNQPVFSWRLNGQQLNDFANDRNGMITVWAMVTTDDPNDPVNPVRTLQPVQVKVVAWHAADYTVDGTFSELNVFPTAPGGHIHLVVQVDVRSKNATSPTDISSQSIATPLDTQEFWIDPAYTRDRIKCRYGMANYENILTGSQRHPYTILNFLLDQPYPPSAVTTGIGVLSQLNMELDELSREQPALAQELSGVFAQTLNVPQQWLSARSAPHK